MAIIQAAENALPSFWGIKPDTLPLELTEKIDSYPERIQSLVKDIGNARSASILKQIDDSLAGDAKKNPDQLWQAKCVAIEKQIKAAQKLATQLTSTDALLEAQKKIEKRSADLRSCRNNQFYEYQAWVIKMSDAAFKPYSAFSLPNRPSESEARKIFKDKYKIEGTNGEHTLAEVDQSLLSPEVSRIFNDVLGKLTARMGAGALVNTEREMGTATKRKPEDF